MKAAKDIVDQPAGVLAKHLYKLAPTDFRGEF